MSQSSPERTDHRPRDNRRLFLLLGALVGVMLLLSVAALTSLFGGGDKKSETTADTPAAPIASPAPAQALQLAVAPQGAARCMAPTVELLQQQQVAFAGTVTSIEGDQVSLDVDSWYLAPTSADGGAAPETVTITAPAAELSKVLESVDFVSGERYLVSAREGAVSLCGLTAPHSDDLESLYAEAYAA